MASIAEEASKRQITRFVIGSFSNCHRGVRLGPTDGMAQPTFPTQERSAEDTLEVPDCLRMPLSYRRASTKLDTLAKRIVQLVTIHRVSLSFRNEELATMDAETKRLLIKSIEEGIDRSRNLPANP